VLAIPGIVRGTRLRCPGSVVTYAALYQFEDEAALRTALSSSEARESRTDWQRWSDHVRDITVQFFGRYEPSRALFRVN
jgi:hypothetical protein